MYKDEEIICPHCGKPSGYTHKGLMFLVVMYDLLCKHCGKVVIPANNGISL